MAGPRRSVVRLGLAAALALVAGACAEIVPQDRASPAIAPTARLLGVSAGPPLSAFGLASADAAAALDSFSASCDVALRREDASGLTRPSDWSAPCATAPGWQRSDAAAFFDRYFVPVRVGDGQAFATGYFEPEILGSRTRRPGFEAPVYAMPDDLVRAWPDSVPASEREGRPPLGRYDETGAFVPYYDRAQIEDGALEGRAPVLAWAADPIELFFLQIQGSGRIRTPEGDVIRIGYAGQNGHDYTGIGGVMRERGLLGDAPGQYEGSMQGIMRYLRENPEDGAALMRMNRSWVFFRELEGDGPIGSIGVPVRGQSSVAVDPAYVPYGAPVVLDPDRPEARGLWVAQDTGGAIKGPNRFDTFWGAGEDARRIAGGMSARGQAYVLLPHAAAERLLRP